MFQNIKKWGRTDFGFGQATDLHFRSGRNACERIFKAENSHFLVSPIDACELQIVTYNEKISAILKNINLKKFK